MLMELTGVNVATFLSYDPNSGSAESMLICHCSGKGYMEKDLFLEIFRKVANSNCSMLRHHFWLVASSFCHRGAGLRMKKNVFIPTVSFFFFFQVSDYLFISVNPNTIHQHDFVHLEGKYFLVKWKIVQMSSGRPSF